MWPWVTGTEVQEKQVSESVTKQYNLTYCNAQMPLPVRVSLVPWAHINLPQTLLRLGFFCTLLPNLQNLTLYNVFQCAGYHSKVTLSVGNPDRHLIHDFLGPPSVWALAAHHRTTQC